MNGSHVAATSGITAMIAEILMWVTHWPLQPLDEPTAMAIAGLTVAFLGGGGLAIFNATRSDGASDPPASPPVTATASAPAAQ